MIHPTTDPARGIVRRRASPHVVEDVQRQLFGGLSTVGHTHDQGKHDSMRAFVERVQRLLIALCDGSDEPNPLRLGYRSLRLVGIEEAAESSLRTLTSSRTFPP